MTATDHAFAERVADGTLQTARLVVRLIVYGLLGAATHRYDCGQALLTGVLAGDLLASAARAVWQWQEGLRAAGAELAVLAIAWLWVRSDLVWPADQADRALLGLAAFGVLTARLGATALTRLGPSDCHAR
ncbi:MAG: hypothetical protein WAT39_22885 [Planctomycetota bacterium]